MTITLTPETEAKIRHRAKREGQDPSAIVDAALSAFLEKEPEDAEVIFVSALPPEHPGEDPRMATLRAIEKQSQFMRTKVSKRDYLREGRSGDMFVRHTEV